MILPCSPETSKALDSSLKRHTALIKRMRQSIGAENREQILKDVESLSLEKYVDELAGAAAEGVGRCKTEKDVWSATEVHTLMFVPSNLFNVLMWTGHIRFPSPIPDYLHANSCQRFKRAPCTNSKSSTGRTYARATGEG
jgi:hypothetical protein